MSSSIASEIPTEILGEIFLFHRSMAIDLPDPDCTKGLKYFPWAAGLVCKHWRSALISTPALWTCFRIRIRRYVDSDSERRTKTVSHAKILRRLSLCLELSRQHLLDIAITSYVPREAWHMLLSQSHRWRYISITVGGYEIGDVLLEPPPFIPRLDSLRVLSVDDRFFLALFEAPRLEKFQLENRCYGVWDTYDEEISDFVRRSSCKIRHLSLYNLEPQNIQDVVSPCHHVEDFYYDHIHHGYNVTSALSSINNNASLPKLRSLTVGYIFEKHDFQYLVKELSKLLESRVRDGAQSSNTPSLGDFEPLKSVKIHLLNRDIKQIPLEMSEALGKWPPVVHVKLQS